jgi:predicted porin
MNNKIKLAVAGAVMSAASAANAGIIIPAGDWTIDINGNVNAYATWIDADKTKGTAPTGGLAVTRDASGESDTQTLNTGLLPAWLGFTGTTRQNDLDVSFTISFQPNVSDNGVTGDGKTPLNRQAFVTFGDKSWGTVKLGKDLGVFASQAILNDMTLLGVGAALGGVSGTSTTLGGIGTGYIYPAWKGQIAYTTPNMNGFSATIAITNPNQGGFGAASTVTQTQAAGDSEVAINATTGLELYQDRFGIEGQVMYEWTGDVAGKVWASGATYDVTVGTNTGATLSDDSFTASVYDIGANINVGNLGVTAYWYDGEGVGSTMMGGLFGATGYDVQSGSAKKRDSDGGYLQATYVIPTGTKLGVAYGVSNLDEASGEDDADLIEKNERWTVGAYHPLTKHLNLVAEYNKITSEGQSSAYENESDTVSLGAILFF